jgi:arylsulfatase A-like enzyme
MDARMSVLRVAFFSFTVSVAACDRPDAGEAAKSDKAEKRADGSKAGTGDPKTEAKGDGRANVGNESGPPTDGSIDRTSLPIEEPIPATSSVMDVRDAPKPPPRFEVKAPEGAPNVIIVLIDDIGFGHSDTFGGPIAMPNLAKLAKTGLRYNRFHTTALCSPSRIALLTGRNHHTNNMGAITEVATAYPGNTGQRPLSVTPLAEILKLNGYNTSAFGKSHETAPWEVSVSGPQDRWPTGAGFERFYGFIAAETNQWVPAIYDDTRRIEPDMKPGYHFTNDMTNQAIAWMRSQHATTPDKPFFMYFATGGTHAPHHVPKEYIERYKGKFDGGWDALREATHKRQLELGVIPEGTALAHKPKDIVDWETVPAEHKKLFARQMEVFAGYAEYTDFEVGRLIDAVEATGELDNTLVFYIVGDNGASAEGGMIGLFNENAFFNNVPETIEQQVSRMDELGGPAGYNHYAAGWAIAGNTPFTWAKQEAGNFGGTRNGMVTHWPKQITEGGGLRSQFHHMIDIAPTVLEAAGLPEPTTVDGIAQTPIEGTSMVYTFADAKAPDRHTTQYFEITGNRGIYHDGWFAGTIHRIAWHSAPDTTFAEDVWELYNVNEDFSQAKNLAAENPAKLEELKALFLKEAERYHALPLDDRSMERFNAEIAGRPELMAGRTSMTLFEGMIGMMENAFINVKNHSFTITASLEVAKGKTDGVLLAQGGRFAGWSLYVKGGKPAFAYNWVAKENYTVASKKALPVGKVEVKVEFQYAGGDPGSGGTAILYVDKVEVARGELAHTVGNIFSADESADVGMDTGTAVTTAYKERENAFSGKIEQIVVEVTK